MNMPTVNNPMLQIYHRMNRILGVGANLILLRHNTQQILMLA